MGSVVESRRSEQTVGDWRKARLELIKKRHQELILKTREIIAADFGDEFDEPYESEDIYETCESELAEVADEE